MCDCLKAHLLCVAAARHARLPRSVILAIRAELRDSPELADLPMAGRTAYLSERISIGEGAAARALGALEHLGMIEDGRLVDDAPEAPAEAMLRPGTRRMRALRARRKAAELSPGLSTVTASDGRDAGDASVTAQASHVTRDVTGIARLTDYKPTRYQTDGVPGRGVAPRHGKASHSQNPVNVDNYNDIKRLGDAELEPALTPAQQWTVNWAQATLLFGIEIGYPQMSAIEEALPYSAIVAFARDRKAHPMPKWVKKHLEVLSAKRKHQPPPAQRSFLLPIEGGRSSDEAKPTMGLGAPGTNTIAPTIGDLPDVLVG
jgi:hypothetical protein